MCPTQGNPLQDTWAKLTACKVGQVLYSVCASMSSEKDVYVGESLGLGRKMRSKVKQRGVGENATCPWRTDRGSKKVQESSRNRRAFFTGWLASPVAVPFFKQNLPRPQILHGSRHSIDLHKTFKALISSQNANI